MCGDAQEQKRLLRRDYRALRRDLPLALRAEEERAVAAWLREGLLKRFPPSPSVQARRLRVCAYLATASEISLDALLCDRELWAVGVRFYLPGTFGDAGGRRGLRFAELPEAAVGAVGALRSILHAKAGYERLSFGILEPPVSALLSEEDFWPDVVLLPALAVDGGGRRLGQGGGYYDRFLTRLAARRGRVEACPFWAVVYCSQFTESELPEESFDRRVDACISADGFRFF